MDVQVSAWGVWLVLSLAVIGFLAVCWVVSGWAEQVRDWWRDRGEGFTEAEEETVASLREQLGLPPERTWEQMTSHLPIVASGEREVHWSSGRCWCNKFHRDQVETIALVPRPQGVLAHLDVKRERRMPGWEAEQRQAYAALGLEYPSGLLARVREAAQ